METVTRFVDRQAGSLSVASTPGADAARTLSATASYPAVGGRQEGVTSLRAATAGRSSRSRCRSRPTACTLCPLTDRASPDSSSDRASRWTRRVSCASTPRRYTTCPRRSKSCIVPPPRITNSRPPTSRQRTAVRTKRADDDRARRQSVAEAFLADKGMRAASHPPPTPKTCYVITDRGGVLFDVSIDQGLAKDVPPEAHRRFRADRRAYQEQVRQDQIAQAALHEEKKQFIAEWISTNGTEEEKARHASGVLPMAEAIARISDQVFAAVDTRPVYVHDGAQRLQRFIRQVTGSADVVVTPADVVARSAHAVMASADEWAAIREIQERLPEAHAVLRHHLLLSKRHQGVPSIVIIGALVTLKHGPFVLRREYIVSDRQSAAAPAPEVDHH